MVTDPKLVFDTYLETTNNLDLINQEMLADGFQQFEINLCLKDKLDAGFDVKQTKAGTFLSFDGEI